MRRPRASFVRTGVIAAILITALSTALAVAETGPSSDASVFRVTSGSRTLDNQGHRGQGVTVAVIDTGIADLPVFDGKVIHRVNLSAAPDEGDQFGHGTFVAGLIHQAAPEANLIALKLSDANGAVDVSQVVAALYWVITHKDEYGIDVVNLSFGNDSKQSAYTSPLNWAVQQLWDAGIVVVASAGNLGDGSGTVTKPGDDPLIISVGSSDENGNSDRSDDTVSLFSSRGPTQDGLTKPDLVAPGARLISYRAPGSTIDTEYPDARVGDDFFRGSGTSFAAPLTVGIVAQMLSADPELNPNQIKYGLLQGASAIDGDPTAFGAGTIRASRALPAAYQGEANEGVVRSTGAGTLQGARGSAVIDVETPVIDETGDVATAVVEVEGDVTAEVPATPADLPDLGEGEDPIEGLEDWINADVLDPAAWDASRWGASRWGASRWGASRWGASRWGASRWGASHWWASRWG